MLLGTRLPLPPIASSARLCRLVRAGLRDVMVTLVDLSRRARDRTILEDLEPQMLNDIGRARLADELAKPHWRA